MINNLNLEERIKELEQELKLLNADYVIACKANQELRKRLARFREIAKKNFNKNKTV